MAILLDFINRIKTNYTDLCNAIADGGLKCCLDIEQLDNSYSSNFNYGLNANVKLIPLEPFICKRTIIGNDGNKINIKTNFGIIQKDFINIDLNIVEIEHKDNYTMYGLLIPRTNDYFNIFNQLSAHFDIFNKDNEKSFILDNAELDMINHVPFTLKYENFELNISNVETALRKQEYTDLVDELYCSEYGL